MEVSGKKKKGGDDHTTGIICDPCRRVNEEENAIFYCTVCNEFLCDADAKAHRKAAMSTTHQLLDRNSMPKQKKGAYEDTVCLIHSANSLEFYCNSHITSCCSVCATNEHKHCEVEYIDDIAKEYEKSSEYKSLVKDIIDLTRRLHCAKQESVDNKNNAQRLHSEIISEIREFRIEINSILDSLENASLKEAKGLLHFDSNTAVSKATNCDNLMAKLQEMTSSIENLRKNKQERQLLIFSKNARAQVKDIEDKLPKLAELNKGNIYKFIPDMTIPQLLQSLRGLGRFEITEETDHKTRQDHDAEVLVHDLNQLVTASHVRNINIKHSTDTFPCCITGGVVIDQTKLVLVDSCNDNVKFVDVISSNVTSCIKLATKPMDITRVEQDQVVVSCGPDKLVFLKVGTTLSIVKQLDLGCNLRGIAYSNNSLLVGIGYPDPSVKMMDLSGNLLKTFQTDSAGNNLFKDPWHIALSEDQNTIFVSDLGYERVTSLRIDGAVQDVYTSGNLRNLRGLAVDRNDNVYVGVSGPHTIHQLSTECQPIKVLLDTKHRIKLPWMVTYCRKENKLYIGYHSASGRNFISVFQLH